LNHDLPGDRKGKPERDPLRLWQRRLVCAKQLELVQEHGNDDLDFHGRQAHSLAKVRSHPESGPVFALEGMGFRAGQKAIRIEGIGVRKHGRVRHREVGGDGNYAARREYVIANLSVVHEASHGHDDGVHAGDLHVTGLQKDHLFECRSSRHASVITEDGLDLLLQVSQHI